MGLVFLKTLRFGVAVEESLAYLDELNNGFFSSDKFGRNATPLYKRLIHLCLKEEVTAVVVESFVRAICSYNFIDSEVIKERQTSTIQVGSIEVKAEYPRYF